MRKVFPCIINEFIALHGRKGRLPQIRDIIALYFYLLSYVDRNELQPNGVPSERFGASVPSKAKIAADLGVAESRIKPLVEILQTHGLLLDVVDKREGTKRYKWYYVSHCPRSSDDGYVVNDDEKIVPDLSKYK
ncbi:hypothetical protein [Thermaerobacillus caldiproteolyticus]|uniref:hypothetical protein n=1 Tax=Thermaerobacillus caldiproteolyticus TaxID=247480 RepID=UPI001F24327D|nr:hypothetical protein [Anoxybacillus caldiproteolyticus]